ncbi:MAG: PAS domain-containing protein, partial [Planctomycetaceae bacterium]
MADPRTPRSRRSAVPASDAGQRMTTEILDALDRSQAVIRFSPDGTILSANGIFLSTMGYSLTEIEGQHHSMFVAESTRLSPEYRDFWQALARGEFRAGQFARVAKGGREVWLQATYNPILDSSGRTIEVIKYATDVSAQRQVQAQAQEEAQRLKQMVENATIRMILADRDFKIVYMNPASLDALRRLEHLLPCRADEIVGRSMDIFHKNPERQRRMLSDPRNLPHTANIRLGDEILELNVTAIHDSMGNYVGPMVNWEVITEREAAKSRELELVEAQRLAKEALESKVNQMVGVVT